MTINEIKSVKYQEPLRPFTLYTLDRRKIRMTHPETISWDDADPSTVFVRQPDAGLGIIDVESIVSISIGEKYADVNTNGATT